MENNLTYTRNGDYLIPDLSLRRTAGEAPGQVRQDAESVPEAAPAHPLQSPAVSEKLYPHLLEIDETANSRLEQMMPQLAKDAGATEQLKASDPMRWVGLMNACKSQAEEDSDGGAYSQLSFLPLRKRANPNHR